MATRLKVCCIASVDEARLALEHGASALGLVAAMPSGPGPIPDERIAEIAASVPRGVATFLLTSHTCADRIVDHVERTGVNTVQLVDAVSAEAHAAIRRALPRIRLVQVVHVRGPESIEEARRASESSDMLLLDSGNPSLMVPELGGTGRTHDWDLSRAIVAATSKPVFLAGGIRAENVAEALARVRPFGVDLCTGVRVRGRLDATRLMALRQAIDDADGHASPASCTS